MVVALLLPIAAVIATYLVRLYYFKQTKPFHAIVNQQLLQVMRGVERQVVMEQDRLGSAELRGLAGFGPRNAARTRGNPATPTRTIHREKSTPTCWSTIIRIPA